MHPPYHSYQGHFTPSFRAIGTHSGNSASTWQDKNSLIGIGGLCYNRRTVCVKDMIVDFLLYQNTYVYLIIATITGALILWSSRRQAKQALSPKQAVQLSNSEHAQFIDIRKQEDFQKAAIAGAKWADPKTLSSEGLGKKPIILVCYTGMSASQVGRRLLKSRQDIYWLQGGMRAWLDEGLPVKATKH